MLTRLSRTIHSRNPPPSIDAGIERFWQVLHALNDYPQSVKAENAIYASLRFHNSTTGESKWFKINIDPLPSSDWKMVDRGELANPEFQKLMASGHFPLSPRMFFHDSEHMFAWMADHHLMRETRNVFKRMQEGHLRINQQKKLDLLTEFLSLPDLSRKAEILALFPETMGVDKILSAQEIFESYKNRDGKIARLLNFDKKVMSLLSQLGGAVGEPGFISRHPERGWAGDQTVRVAIWSEWAPSQMKDAPEMLNLSRHSLLYIIHEFKALLEAYGELDDPNRKFYLKPEEVLLIEDRLFKRLATLEAAFTNAVKLRMTPAEFVKEATSGTQALGPGNERLRVYIESYLPHSSI